MLGAPSISRSLRNGWETTTLKVSLALALKKVVLGLFHSHPNQLTGR
jgi:proteasome lid subunit RPN8/RPN11